MRAALCVCCCEQVSDQRLLKLTLWGCVGCRQLLEMVSDECMRAFTAMKGLSASGGLRAGAA